jgi:hypothetical protein
MLQRLDPTLAFSLNAFGHELRLWKETNQNDWGAIVGSRTNPQVYYLYFEANDATMAKLQVCETARSLAVIEKEKEMPPSDAFLDFWRPLSAVEPVGMGMVDDFVSMTS